MLTELGPFTTSIYTFPIFSLKNFTNLNPGSDIHGVPASETSPTL
jgi:hypothetical protein